MPDLKVRSTLPEKMDQPGVPEAEINQALRELEIINTWLGGYALTLDAVKKLGQLPERFTVMDIGCGGGDLLRELSSYLKQRNYKATLIGVDRNPLMTTRATKQCAAYTDIKFVTADVFDPSLNNLSPDIVMSTLFCHHFDDADLVALMKRQYELASTAVIVNDLHRHPFAYHSIKLITKYFSKSYLVKYDAAVSVARSLKRNEWEKILAKAGITDYEMRWRWAWRWQIIIRKNKQDVA